MEITKEQFLDYEEVRASGVTNMCIVNSVCDLSGLDREQVVEIMGNYSKLSKEYLK